MLALYLELTQKVDENAEVGVGKQAGFLEESVDSLNVPLTGRFAPFVGRHGTWLAEDKELDWCENLCAHRNRTERPAGADKRKGA